MNLGGVRLEVKMVPTTMAKERVWSFTTDAAGNRALEWLEHGQTRRMVDHGSSLLELKTRETFQGQSVALEFARGTMAQQLSELILPNDYLEVKIGATGDPKTHLAFAGFLSGIDDSVQATPTGYRTGLNLTGEGVQKLLNQNIYNWQGVMQQGDDLAKHLYNEETFKAYKTMLESAATLAPNRVIKVLLNIGVENAVKALVDGKKVKAGGLFDYGDPKAGLWNSLYPDTCFPNILQIVSNEWQGTLWSLVQSLAEPDLHETFWTYGAAKEGGEEKPLLIHRPRPFPSKKNNGKVLDVEHWKKLTIHRLGHNGAPTALGVMRRMNDTQRANAFHWGVQYFSDATSGAMWAKLIMGWWMDKIGIAKYGFAPRQVSAGLKPDDRNDFADLVSSVMERVAWQDAPLYLLRNESRAYGTFLPGTHVGQALEDWSTGKASTGYIESVGHAYRCTPQGIQVGTTLGLSRCMPGATFETYPEKVLALVDVQRGDYLKKTGHPSQIAEEAHKTGTAPTLAKSSGSTGVPNGPAITDASRRHGVPAWMVTTIFQKESSLGLDSKAYHVNSAGALGVMQLTPIAVADLKARGYTKSDGSPFELKDRLNAEASLDAGAAYLKVCKDTVSAAGCQETNPNFWKYVADAYYRGPSTAADAGKFAGWNSYGLTNYGGSINVQAQKNAFGGLA